MSEFEMKIQPNYLKLVRAGIKKHEYRLNDEKRQQVQPGDRIRLVSNDDPNDFVVVEVLDRRVFPSWDAALINYWQEDFSGTYYPFEDLMTVMNAFYSGQDIAKYGIVVFGIKLVSE